MKHKNTFFQYQILKDSIFQSFQKLHPKYQYKNPVMFLVYLGSIFCTYSLFANGYAAKEFGFHLQICIWLWFTVLFANFAESYSEGNGKARAESLKKIKTSSMVKLVDGSSTKLVKSSDLRLGDVFLVEAGDIIPMDGEVVEGASTVDESAITGESAPVVRESGGDRSAVTGGTKVTSDWIKVRVTGEVGNSFLDRMIAMVEGAKRQKTPNEIALTILLSFLSLIFLFAVASLYFFVEYSVQEANQKLPSTFSVSVLIGLLVCLIPTTIGGLLSAIGISGMDRLLKKNVISKSGKAIEASGDINVLLLDKTGTITLGNRVATEFLPVNGISEEELAKAAQLSSLADETPEGRSIVILAKEKFQLRERNLQELEGTFIPFSAKTKMSGVDLKNEKIRKGSGEAIKRFLQEKGQSFPTELEKSLESISRKGGTPLVVANEERALGVIYLKDIVKGGIKERFAELRKMGIKTVMITGDNHLTAGAIAFEAGVDDYIAEATPEMKLQRIREEQAKGNLVAMIGDGTNDAPALAQADVGVAMNTGTQAARDAGNMVDLDSNPTKLIEIVETGKQLLMTRGALTTFSIANDFAKYFAILPALFSSLYAHEGLKSPLVVMNVMQLSSPESAILSSVIFNALIIVALIPLALKGVQYRPVGVDSILSRNMLVFGLGGIITPFLGIKMIDWILHLLSGVA